MYDVVIIGAGASGLMLASLLSNMNVLVLEKTNSPGKKLLITGGGRCNLTNLKGNDEFLENIKHNKKYLYSTINKFGPFEVYDYFKSIGLKEEEDNKIFPKSDKASDVLNYLIKKTKCKVNYNEEVIRIEDNLVTTNKNTYQTKYIVVATGGSSYIKTGSSGDHIRLCDLIKQPCVSLFPAETSIITNDKNNLAGTSFDNVYIHEFKESGNLIFTHTGLSGSSIMKISEHIYLKNIKEITIDLLPLIDEKDLKELLHPEKYILNILNNFFSKRFSTYLLELCNIKNDLVKRLNHKNINDMINNIKKYKVSIKTVNDIKFAYVTGGGVDLKYIDTRTFKSKLNDIYFIGECLDIHGPIGGYNLTLAFSTAYSCSIDIKGEKNGFKK